MAVQDVSPPPRKDDGKFDNWMYQLWKRLTASAQFTNIGGSSPILTTAGAGTLNISHGTSGAIPGTYGGASSIPVVVVNTYGHITLATNTSIAAAGTSITGADLTVSTPLTGTLTNVLLRAGTIGHSTSGVIPGTYGGASSYPQLVVNTWGHITAVNTFAISGANLTLNLQNGNYTLGTGDISQVVYREGTATGLSTWTVPSTLGTGALITLINDGTGNVTVTPVGALVFAGTGGTGNRTLPQYGMASVISLGTSRWMISGAGVS